MNIIDAHCVEVFPELKEKFSQAVLNEKSGFGSYVFHEDVLCTWLVEDVSVSATLVRLAAYIEYLALSENRLMRETAQIAVLECLMNRQYSILAPFVRRGGRQLISKARENINFDDGVWLSQ